MIRSGECPVCGYSRADSGGKGESCKGFVSDDGAFAYCQRTESPREQKGEPPAWPHALRAPCDCGSDHRKDAGSSRTRREVARYDYRDAAGVLRFQVVRFADPKDFLQCDATGRWSLKSVSAEQRALPYRLPEIRAALAAGTRRFYVPEGEKDVQALEREEHAATCNAGGAGKWREATTAHIVEACEAAGVPPGDVSFRVWIDKDKDGRKHGGSVRASLLAAGFVVDVVKSREGKDATDHIAGGGAVEDAEPVDPAELEEDGAATKDGGEDSHAEKRATRTFRFVDGETLLAEPDDELDALVEGLLFSGAVTVMVSPRGLGKSQVTLAITTALVGGARVLGHEMTRGRVLLADLDNPRAEVKRRLRRWRGDTSLEWLHYAGRQEEPPLLLDAAGWARVPASDYALVVLESANSLIPANENDTAQFTRGVETAKAIAARGPAVLLNGNTTKDGQHFRGSGVLANLADLTIEVRDVTGWTPSGFGDDWLGALPEAGEAHWAARAARRKGRDTLRLAVTTTKCRLAIEPPPRVVELRMPEEGPWTIADVTAEIEEAHEAARGAAKVDSRRRYHDARDALARLIRERYVAGDPITEGADAIAFLRGEPHDMKREAARKLIASGGAIGDGEPQWRRERLEPGKVGTRGNPYVLIPGTEPWPKATRPLEVLIIPTDAATAIVALMAPLTREVRIEDPTGGWLTLGLGLAAARVEDITPRLLELGVRDPTGEIEAGAAAGLWRLLGGWIISDGQHPEPTPDGPQPSGPTPGGGDVPGAAASNSTPEPLGREGDLAPDARGPCGTGTASIGVVNPLDDKGPPVLDARRARGSSIPTPDAEVAP